MEPKKDKTSNTTQLPLWGVVAMIIYSKRGKLLDTDGILIKAEIIRAYASRGGNRVKYKYVWNGITFSDTAESPGHLRNCRNDRKCIGDSITVVVSESKPSVSRTAE